jgi:hypothetical protein
MKRSENVGLMLMGGVAFAATFAGGMAYMSMNRPSHAAQAAACTPAPNGTQNCQPASRGFSYYVYPSHWGWSSGASAGAKPQQQAALTSTSPRPAATTVSASGTERAGFGSSAKTSMRVSAGG